MCLGPLPMDTIAAGTFFVTVNAKFSYNGKKNCFSGLFLSVTAVRLPDTNTFIVYEFWEAEEEWKR